MKVNCKKSYSFSLKNSNERKLQMLLDKAIAIRDFKNKLSSDFAKNALTYMELSKFELIKCTPNPNKTLSGQDVQHAVSDVYVAYENKIDKFNSLINIKLQDCIEHTYYKKSYKNNPKGSISSSSIKFKHTALSKVTQYLAKFYQENTITYIKAKLENSSDLKPAQIKLYNDILYYINKFGERLISLSKRIKQNALSRCFDTPIQFKSLSFNSLNQISTPIISYNKNDNSIFNVIISIGAMGENKETLEIPSKYSKQFHGELLKYQKGKNTSYTIAFNADTPEKIIIAVDSEREIVNDKNNAVGVDVNVKHNLFSLSNNRTIDYEREFLNDYIKFLKKLDQKKLYIKNKVGRPQPLNKRDTRFYKNWQVRMKDMLKRKCSELVNSIIAEGKDHLVIEDLGQFAKSFAKNEEFEDFKYSRLVRLLNLADIKNILQSICDKNNVQLTLVHAHYTSQTCPKCNFVSRENRKTQEIFQCVNCGHKDNADHNSSINIFNRFHVDVLREKLLYKNKYGCYEPKILKKEIIKESILEYSIITCNHDQLE